LFPAGLRQYYRLNMVGWILKKILGSKNQREIKRLSPMARQIKRARRAVQSALGRRAAREDDCLEERAGGDYRAAGAMGEARRDSARSVAVVKNAARRLTERQQEFTVCDQPMTWNMVHFDVQLVGGMVFASRPDRGNGDRRSKTLVATLPLYLNALTGKGAHLVTVNDYLARRDAEWMGQLYSFLGLTVGVIQHDQSPEERRAQYAMDITYGTNSEFGFDYLRDNGMATTREQQVQRGYNFAIVDEVDSILIDEARTPLIISGLLRFRPISTTSGSRWSISSCASKTWLCNRLASEAKELFDAGKVEEGGLAMFRSSSASRGQTAPAHDGRPDKRKAIDKAELQFYQDARKEELFALKEELFYTIDEKSNESDLSEQGRAFLNPDEPDSFVLRI